MNRLSVYVQPKASLRNTAMATNTESPMDPAIASFRFSTKRD